MLYKDNKFSFLGRRIQSKEYICALIKLSMGALYSSLRENHNTATNSDICGRVMDVSMGAPYSSIRENHNTATNSDICGRVVDVVKFSLS